MPRHARLPSLVRALRDQLPGSGDSVLTADFRTSSLDLVEALRSLAQWLVQKTPVHSQPVRMLLFPLEQFTETRVPVLKSISEVLSLLKELSRCANDKKTELSEYKAKLIAELTMLESKLTAAFKAAFDSLSAALAASCTALIALLKNAAQQGQTYSYSDCVAQHVAALRQGCEDMLSLFEL